MQHELKEKIEEWFVLVEYFGMLQIVSLWGNVKFAKQKQQ